MPAEPHSKFYGTDKITSANRSTRYCVFAALMLLVVSVIAWRRGVYFSGQFDWVVVAKTGLLIAALLIVLWAKGNVAVHGSSLNSPPATALLLVGLYLATSIMGAFFSGGLFSSALIAGRTAVVGYVILALYELVEPMVVISALSRALSVVVVFAVATSTFEHPGLEGRLAGDFLPLHPNEIAFLAAVPLVYLVWGVVNGDTRLWRILAVMGLGVIIFLTQSRTTAFLVAAAILFLTIRGNWNWRFRLSLTVMAVIGLLFTLTFTQAIQHFVSRGGTIQGDSLNSRTIAWTAVLSSPRKASQLLFGEGLAKKMVPVVGQWWDEQILDSSWISAFVQAGLIGLIPAVVLVIYAASQAAGAGRPLNDLWLVLLALAVVRSIVESGLFDTSTSFLIFMVVALGAASCHSSRPSQSFRAITIRPPKREAITLLGTMPGHPENRRPRDSLN